MRPSEVYLSRLNAAADTDITILLKCDTASLARRVHAAIVASASTGSANVIGMRARAIESRSRTAVVVGTYALGPTTRAGPIDVALVQDDPTVVVARWSHLAGDARTCQEVILDCLEHSGLLGGRSTCRCVRFSDFSNRPMAVADAWNLLRERRVADARDVVTSGVAASAPMLRYAPTQFEAVGRAECDSDAIALIELAPNSNIAGTSQFASIVGTVAGVAVRTRYGAPIRLGVTVDVRRHEPSLASVVTGGNLSLLGWINLSGGPEAAAVAAHMGVQRLLRRRFWYQQLAFDAWFADLPAERLQQGSDLIIRHVTGRAPVTITELWRDDGFDCASCGLRRRTTPDGIVPVALPPRYPPTGLTVGITRTRAGSIVVLRRATLPGEAATPWVDAISARWPGGLVQNYGPIAFAATAG